MAPQFYAGAVVERDFKSCGGGWKFERHCAVADIVQWRRAITEIFSGARAPLYLGFAAMLA